MVTVKIKENSKQARLLIEMLKTFSFVEFQDSPRYNAATEKAIKDARSGKGMTKAKDVEDLLHQLQS